MIKHIILITLLGALKRKETPFCFLDTHAGIGLYELSSKQAQKKQEYKNGIEKLWLADQNNQPSQIHDYLEIIKQYNAHETLQHYPGSPIIASHMLRAQDQIILCERHKEDFQTLKNYFYKQKNIAVHDQDAYLAMKAFLPPKQKRGLVLIDAPFELQNEFERIEMALLHALTHWRTGHFMIWYPIKNESLIKSFHRAIQQYQTPYLIIHFYLNEKSVDHQLSACGILLINPPWKTKEILEKSLLPYLSGVLQGRATVWMR